ncbi:hypothetical protein GCM10011351_24060 [Paraliobacillus quinghaiensis]|uniref:Uncharacterized protein n=1 Tax=Paraliobacillus quinghaiensis TaxID=470815 RepID=A0A917WVS3_9BACI|nr:hypothetical protein GCM10011351_24060 [Paraliobacillus quinghaiensis]
MMVREKRNWRCHICNHQDSNAHFAALYEYKKIFGDEITNAAARSFLQIESSTVVKRILKNAGLKKIGENKGSKYIIS